MKKFRRLSVLVFCFIIPFVFSCGAGGDGGGDGGGGQPKLPPAPVVALTLEDAIAIALAEFIEPNYPDRFVLGLIVPQALPAGTKVRPSGDPDDPGRGESFELNSDSYFVFVDPVPTHKYGHHVDYVIIDGNSGTIETKDAFISPSVAGIDFWRTLQDRMTSEDRFLPETDDEILPPVVPIDEAPAELALKPMAITPAQEREIVYIRSTGGSLVAVTVAAASDWDIQNDAENMSDKLEGTGFDVTDFNVNDHTLSEVVSGIQDLTKDLGPDDKFLLYISAHNAGGNRIDYGNSTWSLFPGGYPGPHRPNPQTSLYDLIDSIDAGHINVIIDACFAARLIDFLKKRNYAHSAGGTLKVYAASASDKTAEGALVIESILEVITYGLYESGSTYTEDFIDALDDIDVDANDDGTVDVSEVENAIDAAHDKVENDLNGGDEQQPENETFSAAPPQEVSHIAVSQTEFTFVHNMGLSDCPQGIGSFQITNTGTGTLNWTITENVAWLNINPSSGTAPSTVELEFNCNVSGAGPVSGSFNINAEGADNSPVTGSVSGTVN